MISFDLTEWLPLQRKRVEVLLAARMGEISQRCPPRLSEAMKYSLLDGGKRLRPVLCLAFAQAVSKATGGGGRPAEDAACAVELIHTYSLIHDDLPAMDDDELRRGRPTSHKVYGEAMAILAGDALLTEAFAVLGTGPEREVRCRMVEVLSLAAGARGMVGGQVLDIAADRPSEEAYLLRLHRQKTGALIRAACLLGGLAGGGGDATCAAAEVYGESVGLAFQIADDLLDVTSTPDVLGKPTGADSEKGRHTFPAVVGLERSRALAWELVQGALDAVRVVEPEPGPLAALARYAVERTS